MRISSLDKTGSFWQKPQLKHIGVKITHRPADEQAVQETQISTVELRSYSRDTPQELLHTQNVPIASETPIHLDKLLGALHQVGEQFNLENALYLHEHTAAWVHDIKEGMGIPEKTDTTHRLFLQSSVGDIELDLAQLNPERLQDVFAEALAQLASADLQTQYAALGSYHAISEGFNPSSALDQKAAELIEIANQLENKLVLAPSPDSPDILMLLRAFREIIEQLDIDVTAIQKKQSTLKRETQKITDTFAEQLQIRLRRLQHYAQTSQSAEWEMVKLLK